MTRFFTTAALLAFSFTAAQGSAEILIASGGASAAGNGSFFSDSTGTVAGAAVGVNGQAVTSTNTNGRALGGNGSNPATDFTSFASLANNPGIQIDGWTNFRWRYLGGNNAFGFLENGGRLAKADAANDGQAFSNSSDFYLMSDAYTPGIADASNTFNISALVGSDTSSGTATVTLTTYLIFDDTTITQVDTRSITGNPDPDDLNLTGIAPGQAYTTVRLLLALDAPSVGTNTRGLIDDVNFEVVPEPSSLALLGLGGLLIARRRRG